MFSTLRHANLGDARFILEPTGAPFDKNRQNKAVRRACVRCRSKKVKCTGEKEGCRGCLKNNRECSYTYSQKSGSPQGRPSPRPSASASASAPRTMMLPSPPATDRRSSVPDFMQHEKEEPEIFGSMTISPSDESPAYHFSPGLGRDCDTEARYVNGTYHDINPPFDFQNVFFDHSLGTSVATTTAASATVTTASELATPATTTPSTESSGGEPPTTTPHDSNNSVAGARRGCCSCLKRTMSTYEMVEICLVWASRDEARALPLGADEMLRYQKEALVSCESTLRCEACSLEPEQVMLMISICNKLLASIVEMRHTLLTTSTCERQQQQARDGGFGSRHPASASTAATLKRQQQPRQPQQQQQRWPPALSIPTAAKLPPPAIPHRHPHRHSYALDGGQQQEWPATTGGGGGGGGYANCAGDDCGNDNSMGLDLDLELELDLDFDLDIGSRRRASVLSIDRQWGWRIDDEDKLQILKSLSDDRARRLEHLVRRMGEVVAAAEAEASSSSSSSGRGQSRRCWVAHRSMIRDLAERFAKEIEM